MSSVAKGRGERKKAVRRPQSPSARREAGYEVAPADAPPRRLRQPQRPADDVILEVLVRHLGLARPDAAADGDAGGVHGLRVAGHERMPPIGGPSLGEQHVMRRTAAAT